MRTTNGGSGRLGCVTGLCLALALQGCVSGVDYARPGADAQQIEADRHDCAETAPVVTGVLAGGAFGAVAGAGVSASGGGKGPAVLVGLLIGIAYGLVAGLMTDDNGADYDRCMRAKGYHPV